MKRLATCSALMVCSMVAACQDEPCYVVAQRFAFTTPSGASELLPGEPVRWEWVPEPADLPMAIGLQGTNTLVGIGAGSLADGGITVLREDATAIPPDVYEIEVNITLDCVESFYAYRPGARLPVVAQGITFPDTGYIIASDEVPRPIRVRTVSLSTMDVELFVDPSTTTDGDELRFARNTLLGQTRPSDGAYQFTGMTTEGAEIPGGDYHLLARVHARDGIVYDMPGPSLRWVILP